MRPRCIETIMATTRWNNRVSSKYKRVFPKNRTICSKEEKRKKKEKRRICIKLETKLYSPCYETILYAQQITLKKTVLFDTIYSLRVPDILI